ncbi:unnamed protein product [Urochloa humidicola]
MRRDGTPSWFHAQRFVHVYSSSEGFNSWGCPQFMRRSDLEESSEYLVDGCVTFKCWITVLHDGDRMPVPASDLGTHLGRLLDSGDCSDVSFSVAGEAFRAHRAVLAARSPVFNCSRLCSLDPWRTRRCPPSRCATSSPRFSGCC